MSPPAPVICVFDGPRTCSQLFNKLFAAHEQLQQIFHPFMGCSMYGPERMTARLRGSPASRQAKSDLAATYDLHEETYEAASDRLRNGISDAHTAGKIPWIKDHLICLMKVDLMLEGHESDPLGDLKPDLNPTMIPDNLFWTMTPIILIRHPALRVPAYYRAQRPVFKEQANEEVFDAMISSRWAKMVLDAYKFRPEAATPIVLDAQDVVHNTEALTEEICALLNVDYDGVQYEWDAVPREKWPSDQIMQGFFQTLLKSDGVKREGEPAERHLDVDHEMERWRQEFGHDTAKQLREVVDRDLPTYEYLKQHRIKL